MVEFKTSEEIWHIYCKRHNLKIVPKNKLSYKSKSFDKKLWLSKEEYEKRIEEFNEKLDDAIEVEKMYNKLKSKLEEKEKEIEELNFKLNIAYKKGIEDFTQLQNSIPKSEIKTVLRSICKHKNIDTENCQVCEAYFKLIETRG